MVWLGLRSRLEVGVATWLGWRPAFGVAEGHWPLRSRPRFEVATWPIEIGVTTWFVQIGRKRSRDPVLRSREVATWPRLLAGLVSRPGLWVTIGQAQQEQLRTATRARPGNCACSVRVTWVLGVRTVHTTQFCDSALFRVTVWITVHGHCS